MKVHVLALATLVAGAVACGGGASSHQAMPRADAVASVPEAPFAFHDRTFLESWPMRSEVERAERDARKEERQHYRQEQAKLERMRQRRCASMPAPHFATPEQAMTYLASAWNRRDFARECQVTDPEGRLQLELMRHEAVNLSLMRCEDLGDGLYGCTFRHDYPPRMHKRSGRGRAYMYVAAALNPGWYVTGKVGCG